jgi:hypothetical protein
MVPKLGVEQGESRSQVRYQVVQDLGVLLGLLRHVGLVHFAVLEPTLTDSISRYVVVDCSDTIPSIFPLTSSNLRLLPVVIVFGTGLTDK